MRALFVLAAAACLTAGAAAQPPAPPGDKDVKWSFDDRLTKLEGRVTALEKRATVGAPPAAARPVTAKMQAVGFGWGDVTDLASHLANLLERDGPTVAHIVKNGLRLIAAITDRDLSGIIAALESGRGDIYQIVADIRAEFGLAAAPRMGAAPTWSGAGPPYPYLVAGERDFRYWSPQTYGAPVYGHHLAPVYGYAGDCGASAVRTAVAAGDCGSAAVRYGAVGDCGASAATGARRVGLFPNRPRLFGGRIRGGCGN
jgi:hypothetical protein